jgi:Fe2+ or Zn2+ uptake regulation protein
MISRKYLAENCRESIKNSNSIKHLIQCDSAAAATNLMIEYTIYCDECGEMIDIQSGSARQARKKAKAKGVLVRILRKDYCPKCAEKLQDEGKFDGSPTKD